MCVAKMASDACGPPKLFFEKGLPNEPWNGFGTMPAAPRRCKHTIPITYMNHPLGPLSDHPSDKRSTPSNDTAIIVNIEIAPSADDCTDARPCCWRLTHTTPPCSLVVDPGLRS